MEEYYKGYTIVVTVGPADRKFKWKPTCSILAKGSRSVIKDIEWVLDYETCEQAERLGLLISKKWIDETKRREPLV